ncbi:kinase-like domain-containing protein [Mycena galericulata]|nr:kinase-like domain-containing protein [Mycena galericulata]
MWVQTSIAILKAACNPRLPELWHTLDGYLTPRSSDSLINAVIGSVECRKTLLEISSELGLANDPNFWDAFQTDEKHISVLFAWILGSKSQEEIIMSLEGDSAQGFLDAAQDAVDRGSLDEGLDCKTRRIILKLSESSDKLPSCLFITGVTGRGEHPTCGGGFGDVYQATYGGKSVALKHVRPFVQSSDVRRIRLKFCQEALVWRELHHPHILPFLGIDRESFSSSLCMISPWMRNGTVLHYLNNHGRGKVDKLLFEIAQGLEYLHSRNIVHGDLRGGNILINDDWSACLADFGLSGSSYATPSMRSSTRAGSLRWMAPELIDPGRFGYKFARTAASDIYAFGCVCVELYTGQTPFSELSEPAALLKVVNGDRAGRPSGSPAMSDVFWQCVTKYWAQNPATRPVAESIVRDWSSRGED